MLINQGKLEVSVTTLTINKAATDFDPPQEEKLRNNFPINRKGLVDNNVGSGNLLGSFREKNAKTSKIQKC